MVARRVYLFRKAFICRFGFFSGSSVRASRAARKRAVLARVASLAASCSFMTWVEFYIAALFHLRRRSGFASVFRLDFIDRRLMLRALRIMPHAIDLGILPTARKQCEF